MRPAGTTVTAGLGAVFLALAAGLGVSAVAGAAGVSAGPSARVAVAHPVPARSDVAGLAATSATPAYLIGDAPAEAGRRVGAIAANGQSLAWLSPAGSSAHDADASVDGRTIAWLEGPTTPATGRRVPVRLVLVRAGVRSQPMSGRLTPPDVLPDGSGLVVGRDRDVWRLVGADAAVARAWQAPAGEQVVSVGAAPDGGSIVVTSLDQRQRWHLRLVRPGTGTIVLHRAGGRSLPGERPAWSPGSAAALVAWSSGPRHAAMRFLRVAARDGTVSATALAPPLTSLTWMSTGILARSGAVMLKVASPGARPRQAWAIPGAGRVLRGIVVVSRAPVGPGGTPVASPPATSPPGPGATTSASPGLTASASASTVPTGTPSGSTAAPTGAPTGAPSGTGSSSASSTPAPTGTVPAAGSTARYDIGSPDLQDVWVDPVNGDDTRSGTTRGQALATVREAWARVPASTTLDRGFRIQLVPGTYDEADLVGYWEHRWGSATAPVLINAADGAHTVRFTSDLNVFDTRYLYLIGIDVIRSGEGFHCERCSFVLLRQMHLAGGGAAQEVVKVNQSDHFFLEDSEVDGSFWSAVDFVAVQYGHLLGNRIHGAGDWCAYVKGGSAYIMVDGNEFFDCSTGGFTAGQGTGFEFMVSPWLHYEAYGIRVVNNVVHDTEGAGLGVNGGYDILLAYNTLYRVGSRSHVLEVVHGARGCNGNTAACQERHDAGGWGSPSAEGQWIPNRHVLIVDNIVYNPAGYQSAWQQFAVAGPEDPPAGSGVPTPSLADDGLVIAGNVIWNGGADMELGVGAGCPDSNPTCNAAQLRADNRINTLEPDLVDPVAGDFRPRPGGSIAGLAATSIAEFGWSDLPARPLAPAGGTDNRVPLNRAGEARSGWGHPGAY